MKSAISKSRKQPGVPPKTLRDLVEVTTPLAKGLIAGRCGLHPLAFGLIPKIHDPKHGDGFGIATYGRWDQKGVRAEAVKDARFFAAFDSVGLRKDCECSYTAWVLYYPTSKVHLDGVATGEVIVVVAFGRQKRLFKYIPCIRHGRKYSFGNAQEVDATQLHHFLKTLPPEVGVLKKLLAVERE
jgi:hypothetical protein